MTYLVNTPSSGSEGVSADHFTLEDGAVLFYDKSGDFVIAYAAGTWTTFFPEESSDD